MLDCNMKKNLFNLKFFNHNFLITGGAGFIGSNLVSYLMNNNANLVRVVDNLSTGNLDNIKQYLDSPNFEFINGDIIDPLLCEKAVTNINFISHQAALGSVPRSISTPLHTHSSNVTGFLNLINAAKKSLKLKNFVYASSSSVYGDSPILPKIEGNEGEVLSPYAGSKQMNEIYANIFSKVYNFNSVGLRYFNIFGPRQNPDSEYSAVIPVFCRKIINNQTCVINGKGDTSRDFTYVDNAVIANLLALKSELNTHQVFNIGCGSNYSLNNLVEKLEEISAKKITVKYGSERKGDVKHSHANIDKANSLLNFEPVVSFEEGLNLTYKYYSNLENEK